MALRKAQNGAFVSKILELFLNYTESISSFRVHWVISSVLSLPLGKII